MGKPQKRLFTGEEVKVTKDGSIVTTMTTDPLPLNKWVSVGGKPPKAR